MTGSPVASGPKGDRPRVILIGAGVRGKKWARVISEAPDATLAAIVDQDASRARRTRDNYAPEALVESDFTSALRRLDADAAVIATPPDSHHSLVSQAFDCGLDVLCEKPLSDDLGEVLDLIVSAESAGHHLLVGMNFRYLPSSRGSFITCKAVSWVHSATGTSPIIANGMATATT